MALVLSNSHTQWQRITQLGILLLWVTIKIRKREKIWWRKWDYWMWLSFWRRQQITLAETLIETTKMIKLQKLHLLCEDNFSNMLFLFFPSVEHEEVKSSGSSWNRWGSSSWNLACNHYLHGCVSNNFYSWFLKKCSQ